MVMRAMRQGAMGGVLKFVLFGLMTMAVGGMVFMDIGGFFSGGGVSRTDVARVGREKISLPAFDRNVQRTLGQIGISSAEAYKAGYIDQILSSEIQSRLMGRAAQDVGISVGERRIAEQIRTLLGPMVGPGQDPKQVLNQILMNQGLSEAELAGSIGQEITTGVLNQTVAGGFAQISPSIVRDLYAFENETRDIVFIAYPESEVKSATTPDDAQLKQVYEATREIYATPEFRTLQLVTLDSSALEKTIAIDDQEIRDAYDDSIDLYTEKEQRTLDQALFEKEEDAKAVAEKAKSGGLQAAVKAVTGRDTDYLGEKTFETDTIPAELKTQAASAKAGDTIGPVKTAIGWQVVTLKDITAAKTKPFESVKKEIRDELLSNKIIDQQYALSGEIEDLLAGGATLDEIKSQPGVTVTALPAINSFGLDKANKDVLKDHEKARSFILENGFQISEGETSPMSEIGDTFMAIHVQSIQPKTYAPFESLRADILKRWMTDQHRVENRLQVTEALEDLNAKTQSPADFAKAQNKPLQSRSGINRKTAPAKPLIDRSWANIFEATPNEPFIIDIDGGYALAWVTKATLPESIDTASKEYKEFEAGLIKATQNEAMMTYGESKREKYGAKVNQRLLEQTYARTSND